MEGGWCASKKRKNVPVFNNVHSLITNLSSMRVLILLNF